LVKMALVLAATLAVASSYQSSHAANITYQDFSLRSYQKINITSQEASVKSPQTSNITFPQWSQKSSQNAKITSPQASVKSSQPVTITCPEGYSLLGLSCYLVSHTPVTGDLAGAFCQSRGGAVAVVDTQQEMDLLRDALLNSTVYLGVNIRRYREDLFGFLLRMAGHSGYTNFHAGEPDNYGAEDCVVADAGSKFEWKDVHCTEYHPVLCKTPALVVEQRPSCGEEAHMYADDTCFWVRRDQIYNISAAEETCKDRGMQLASIHSQEENSFLHNLTYGYTTWIGLVDQTGTKEFAWSDGSALDYENWFTNEPGDDPDYNCVFLWGADGGWFDTACRVLYGVVCRGSTW